MAQLRKHSVRVDVRNIGGIDEASVTLSDGVSVLTGRNATNRVPDPPAMPTTPTPSNRVAAVAGTGAGAVCPTSADETPSKRATLIRPMCY